MKYRVAVMVRAVVEVEAQDHTLAKELAMHNVRRGQPLLDARPMFVEYTEPAGEPATRVA